MRGTCSQGYMPTIGSTAGVDGVKMILLPFASGLAELIM
jgi:hypothetical protein